MLTMLITQKLDVIEKNWLQIWIQHPKIVLDLTATKILLNRVMNMQFGIFFVVRTSCPNINLHVQFYRFN